MSRMPVQLEVFWVQPDVSGGRLIVRGGSLAFQWWRYGNVARTV